MSETLYGESSVDIRSYPNTPIENDEQAARRRALTTSLCEFNSETWKSKKDAGLSLNAEVEGISVPNELAEFSEELIEMHNLV